MKPVDRDDAAAAAARAAAEAARRAAAEAARRAAAAAQRQAAAAAKLAAKPKNDEFSTGVGKALRVQSFKNDSVLSYIPPEDRTTIGPVASKAASASTSVSLAYDKGGAKAAAEELKKQTADATPEVAAAIVRASQPTVDKITEELGKISKLADGGQGDANDFGKQFDSTVADLAAATQAASKGPGGAEVVADVAASIATQMGKTASVVSTKRWATR